MVKLKKVKQIVGLIEDLKLKIPNINNMIMEGQVWQLIVSIPDLCLVSYFKSFVL